MVDTVGSIERRVHALLEDVGELSFLGLVHFCCRSRLVKLQVAHMHVLFEALKLFGVLEGSHEV